MTDVFKGLFDARDWEEGSLPMIHCYLFARTVETAEDIVKVRLGHSSDAAIWRHLLYRCRRRAGRLRANGVPPWGQRGEYHLGGSIENAIVHPVRDVAPNKVRAHLRLECARNSILRPGISCPLRGRECSSIGRVTRMSLCCVQHMFCLSFKLSAAVAFAAEGNYGADGTRRPHHMEEPVVADAPPPSKRIRVDEGAKIS